MPREEVGWDDWDDWYFEMKNNADKKVPKAVNWPSTSILQKLRDEYEEEFEDKVSEVDEKLKTFLEVIEDLETDDVGDYISRNEQFLKMFDEFDWTEDDIADDDIAEE